MNRFLIFIVLLSQIALAQKTRKYANEFMAIGVDAAAFGMGKAVVATTANVHAAYWNPAGLLSLESNQGGLMHAEYFAGIAKYDYAAYAFPIDDHSAVGISLIRFGVDDILNTTELIDSQGNIDYTRIKLFSAADYALNIAYAKQLIFNELKFGINSKIIRRIIGEVATSWGVGFDVGLQYENNNWKYGLMVRDITTTYNAWRFDADELAKIQQAIPNQNNEIPDTVEITLPTVQIGMARTFEFNRDFSVLAEMDLNMRFAKTNDIISSSMMSIDPALGVQFNYLDMIFVRAGINNVQKEQLFDSSTSVNFQPNVGLGFRYEGIQLDYALTNIASIGNALYSNIFSLTIDFSYFK